jgi:protein-S-isoprenylcysteine O-methyltransferase Ste14
VSITRLRLRITRMLALLVVLVCVFGTTKWAMTSPLIEESLFFLGIAMAGFGASGRAWATSFISGHKSSELITTGPYSLCRNPLYFFSLILAVGLGFCTETITVPVVIGLALLPIYHFQIKREEKLLAGVFGPDYDAYLATIPRFLPSGKLYSEPDEITVSPRLMKKGFFGIAFLLLLIGVAEMLEFLHQTGSLPVFFQVY